MTRVRPLLLSLLGCCLLQSLALAQGMAPASGFAHVNQTSLRYQLAGSGTQTIVLLHEMGMSMEGWDDVFVALARTHRVLRYDLRGFGLSEKLRGAVTIEDEVADLCALLDKLGISEPVTLVGGAVGGAIALRFAATYPQRSLAVMAISPAVGVAPANRAASLASAARLERVGMRAHVDATLDETYPAAIRTGHEDRLSRWLALQYANDPVSVAATLRMIAITEWDATWPAIRCPVWIVAAAMYPARSKASQQAIAAAIPHGHFEVVDTGHFMPLQSPELLLPLLNDFLQPPAR